MRGRLGIPGRSKRNSDGCRQCTCTKPVNHALCLPWNLRRNVQRRLTLAAAGGADQEFSRWVPGALPIMICFHEMLAVDAPAARGSGRLQLDSGPTSVLIRGRGVEDVSRCLRRSRSLMEAEVSGIAGDRLCSVDDLFCDAADRFLARSTSRRSRPPASTFAISAIERVIEEHARGDLSRRLGNPRQARATHRRRDPLGRSRQRRRRPAQGCADRERPLVAISRSRDWTRCRNLQRDTPARKRRLGGASRRPVGIPAGTTPNPKSVARLQQQGRHPRRDASVTTSTCVTSKVAARSLLSKAKDNNASCAIGPLIRVFDEYFTLMTCARRRELRDHGNGQLPAERPKPDERD